MWKINLDLEYHIRNGTKIGLRKCPRYREAYYPAKFYVVSLALRVEMITEGQVADASLIQRTWLSFAKQRIMGIYIDSLI